MTLQAKRTISLSTILNIISTRNKNMVTHQMMRMVSFSTDQNITETKNHDKTIYQKMSTDFKAIYWNKIKIISKEKVPIG